MNVFRRFYYRLITRNIWRQIKKHYPEAKDVNFKFCKIGSDGINGQYEAYSKTISISIINPFDYTQGHIMQVGGVKTPKENITKTILHELRHHMQHKDEEIWKYPDLTNMTLRFVSTDKDYYALPAEMNANAFAYNEWEKIWKFKIK